MSIYLSVLTPSETASKLPWTCVEQPFFRGDSATLLATTLLPKATQGRAGSLQSFFPQRRTKGCKSLVAVRVS